MRISLPRVLNTTSVCIFVRDESERTLPGYSAAFQSVAHRLERLSGESCDGAASSSGIQSHSILRGL
ncbi:hypothetical protein DEO72_LG9g1893 [Vigna unguiculata]|uniref:Uncharacterized protein n=1 Tax=Vigna unguiculata TaxID=3917 RepID=A0A4D6N304_VIGUN|nr:hypothetical protein DEO72_LG9g1893 [Vigna unguiculata]